MSLRDQLLKAGIVDRKKVRSANRDLKKKRREDQASRDSKKEIAAREAAEAAARKAAEEARRAQDAADRKAAETAMERRRAVERLLRDYSLAPRPGQQRFWFVTADRKTVLKLEIPLSWAHDLRAGALAIVWLGDDPHPERAEHRVFRGEAVARLRQHAPERVLFFNDAPPPDDDPAEQLYAPATS
jgi:uncharacterized protein YaiL (DUF2058 family)